MREALYKSSGKFVARAREEGQGGGGDGHSMGWKGQY